MAAIGFGLRPYRNLNAATGNFSINGGFQIAYNNAHTFGNGDIVIPLSTGYLDLATASSNPVLGIFNMCSYPNPANTIQPQGQRIWNAPTLASNVVVTAQYWDAPDVVFQVMASASLTQSCIGLNANFLSNGLPNATTGISTLQLDTTTISTLNSLPLRIVELYPGQSNALTNVNPILGVVLNTSLQNATSGV